MPSSDDDDHDAPSGGRQPTGCATPSGKLAPRLWLTTPAGLEDLAARECAECSGWSVERTERGVVDPVTTFSRFFGAPFMPRLPDHYAKLLGEKMAQHDTKVFLVNTGWSGGAYGTGSRISLEYTRKIVDAIHTGHLANASSETAKI